MISCIVIQSRFIEIRLFIWLLLALIYKLVSAGKAFFGHDTAFHFKLFTLLVPCLEFLIMLPQVVGSDLVIKYSYYTTLPVLTRQSNIDSTFACFWIMRATCRSYLFPIEVYRNLLRQIEFVYVLQKDSLCFLL